MLDSLGNNYRRGRHPDPKTGPKVASVLRAVADELEPKVPAGCRSRVWCQLVSVTDTF